MLKVTVNWASWKVKDVHDMMLALLASFRGHLRPLPGVGEGGADVKFAPKTLRLCCQGKASESRPPWPCKRRSKAVR